MGSNRKRRTSGTRRRAARPAARGSEPRASLYDEVTAKIISQFEAGIFPWVPRLVRSNN
jgi:antirestriction protein ArdC